MALHRVDGHQTPAQVSVCGTPSPELGWGGPGTGTGCPREGPGPTHCKTSERREAHDDPLFGTPYQRELTPTLYSWVRNLQKTIQLNSRCFILIVSRYLFLLVNNVVLVI